MFNIILNVEYSRNFEETKTSNKYKNVNLFLFLKIIIPIFYKL